jgi:AraC-like DNA-binding protein
MTMEDLACFDIRQSTTALFRRINLTQAALMVVRSGRKTIVLPDGRVLGAKPGEAIAVSGGLVVDVGNDPGSSSDYRAEVFMFSNGWLNSLPPRTGNDCGTVRISSDFAETIFACRRMVNESEALPAVVRAHRLLEVLVWLESEGIALHGAPDTLAARIRRMVADRPERSWTTDEVVAALAAEGHAMSAATLRRRLVDEGAGLTEIITDTRLSLALGRLQASEAPINRIAAECGYDSASRFAIRFRARFGLSPSEIRQRRKDIERIGTANERSGVALRVAAG